MDRKFLYDVEVMQALRHVKEKIESQGYQVDTRWIDYHGDQCPRCGQKFKVYNHSVKGAASASAFLVSEQNKAVVYCVCKSCNREILRTQLGNGKTLDTESRIIEKLPDLKRASDEPPTKEEFKHQMDVLNKI
ncbi:hypothetical protein [Robertmurraya sp.]|uniref:hypothetical protein n=1 Tax=Robertmurraya sp. TaxID=2837525 RepID=UPI0037038B5C